MSVSSNRALTSKRFQIVASSSLDSDEQTVDRVVDDLVSANVRTDSLNVRREYAGTLEPFLVESSLGEGVGRGRDRRIR